MIDQRTSGRCQFSPSEMTVVTITYTQSMYRARIMRMCSRTRHHHQSCDGRFALKIHMTSICNDIINTACMYSQGCDGRFALRVQPAPKSVRTKIDNARSQRSRCSSIIHTGHTDHTDDTIHRDNGVETPCSCALGSNLLRRYMFVNAQATHPSSADPRQSCPSSVWERYSLHYKQ